MSSLLCPTSCCQLLLVLSNNWETVKGKLYRFQRSSTNTEWQPVNSPCSVTLGKKGLAWGRGLLDFQDQKGPNKQERDGKSPAGIFCLGPVFGDEAHRIYAKNIDFSPINEGWEWIDDPQSTSYNQLVFVNSIQKRDWKSSENMKAIGFLYALGVVVQHNMHPIQAGKGSAIFMHIGRSPETGTGGCTAMGEKDLVETVAWLRADHHPCLVQLPLAEYLKKKNLWGLPLCVTSSSTEV